MEEKAEVTETPLEAELVEHVERKPSKLKATPELDRIDQLRAAVEITRDAVHAVSITASELVGEAAAFMGVIGKQGELVNPFEDIDAPIWAEEEVPPEMLEAAYAYCEELTKREAGNFYHSFKYLPDDKRLEMCAYYAFCRRADDIADDDYVDVFPGSAGADDPEAKAYREHWKKCMEACPADPFFEMHDLKVETSDSLAVSHSLTHCGATVEGEQQGGWMRVTQVWQRNGDQWQILHEHFSSPFNPEDMSLIMDWHPNHAPVRFR